MSDAQLLEELARRRLSAASVDLTAIEEHVEQTQQLVNEGALRAAIARLPAESGVPKPCPKCGKPVPVKTHNRERRVLTIAGELRLSRNYHYCRHCRTGFYPRDIELKLPENGDVSDAMEKRILDFGVNDTFESAAERWSLHHATPISSNLIRRVVDRVGSRADEAFSELTLQQSCRASPDEPPRALVVAADGSMLLTREAAWKEAKVGVVARAEDILREKNRGAVTAARYVAVLGGQQEFRNALHAALEAERADEATSIVWLGDGAPENWTLAHELCPFATQVLDLPHAIQNGVACGKVLLGEGDCALISWEQRLKQLIDAPSPDAAIRELMDCLPLAETEEQLAALNQLVGYYRSNARRMRYAEFRQAGLPVGSGIVESAHRHVLQVRMKRAGQRWSLPRARRMARLRALYRTAGARRFHRAIREALTPPSLPEHSLLPSGPHRAKHRYTLSRCSRFNRAASN